MSKRVIFRSLGIILAFVVYTFVNELVKKCPDKEDKLFNKLGYYLLAAFIGFFLKPELNKKYKRIASVFGCIVYSILIGLTCWYL